MMLSFPLHTDLSKEVEINENLIIIRKNKSEPLFQSKCFLLLISSVLSSRETQFLL